MYCGINGWAYFREKSTLCNNFIQKKGVGVFSRVGLFSGDYSTMYSLVDYLNSITCFFHYCSYHRQNWLQTAEASQLVVRQTIPTIVLLMRVKLQLSFFQPPFSGKSWTETIWRCFSLFIALECSSQSKMQHSWFRRQMPQLQLS